MGFAFSSVWVRLRVTKVQRIHRLRYEEGLWCKLWEEVLGATESPFLTEVLCSVLQSYKVVPPPVISWFIIPISLDITPKNPSYSTYKPTWLTMGHHLVHQVLIWSAHIAGGGEANWHSTGRESAASATAAGDRRWGACAHGGHLLSPQVRCVQGGAP